MLIEVTREVAEQLADGWSHGLYWRAMRHDVVEYGFSSMSTMQSAVYIQLLVPTSRHNAALAELCDVGELPPLYGSGHSIPVLERVSSYCFYPGFGHTGIPWYDTYYGALLMAADRQAVVGYMILGSWYPGCPAAVCYRIQRGEFMQYLQPAAEHVCACVAAAISPVSASPEIPCGTT